MMLDTIQDKQHELMIAVHGLFFFYFTSIHLIIFEEKCLILLVP